MLRIRGVVFLLLLQLKSRKLLLLQLAIFDKIIRHKLVLSCARGAQASEQAKNAASP